jgi:hypothetical protein
MTDFYGAHQQAFAIQSQLGQHALDMNEVRQANWKNSQTAFRTLKKLDTAKEDSDLKSDAESDAASVPKVLSTGKAFGEAGADVVSTLRAGGTYGQAASEGLRSLQAAGEGTKLFGEGAVAAKEAGGLEGVVGNILSVAGGGGEIAESFAKVGATGVGVASAGMATLQDIDNLWNTGNIFNTKDAQGKTVKQNLGQDIGNLATIGAGVLDVAAVFTGGALAPVAAAANVAAATTSTIASIDADEKEKSTDAKDAPPAKPPPTIAPQGFTQYGILANRSHNPLEHIG